LLSYALRSHPRNKKKQLKKKELEETFNESNQPKSIYLELQ